ncbi:unnamed protein product [Psylliodes chrysocephalus]|uniref:Uncharacterized protein n=1 Tax=Psylliodes chrysocephalus TaxID=3402493 RepID=A0A9P0CH03_9CUCU|nr:unnamed protein product [Psylliodes chrysocephala]
MRGEEYLGYTRTKDGKVFHNKMRQPKTMGPSCTSSKCVKYKTRFCNTINMETRKVIFNKFWKELEWDQKKIYVTSLMKKKSTARKFVAGKSRRSFTYEYFLRVENEVKQPKKEDQCNICVSYSAGNVTDEEYTRHIELKDAARLVKSEDKRKAEIGDQYTFVMDVQAVKLCPVNNENKFYFKTRLKLHNFTIYNLASHQCTNYWWNESEADLVSSVFTTIIINHLEKYCTEDKPTVLWSDGCPYQNRNVVLAKLC